MAGSYLANDAGKLPPEAGAGAVEPGAFAGDGDVLAGKAARDNETMAEAAQRADDRPAGRVANGEGADVVPDGERREEPFVLPRGEDGAGIGVELDGAHGALPEEQGPEETAATAREKCQLIQH